MGLGCQAVGAAGDGVDHHPTDEGDTHVWVTLDIFLIQSLFSPLPDLPFSLSEKFKVQLQKQWCEKKYSTAQLNFKKWLIALQSFPVKQSFVKANGTNSGRDSKSLRYGNWLWISAENCRSVHLCLILDKWWLFVCKDVINLKSQEGTVWQPVAVFSGLSSIFAYIYVEKYTLFKIDVAFFEHIEKTEPKHSAAGDIYILKCETTLKTNRTRSRQ